MRLLFFVIMILSLPTAYQCTSDGTPEAPNTEVTESTTLVESTRTLEQSEAYRFAIGYNLFEEEAIKQGTDDWERSMSSVMEATKDLGIVFLYPKTDELQEVDLLNAEGEKVATENVQGFFDELGAGYVLLEEGKEPDFVEYSPDMEVSIRKYFQ